MSVDDRAARLLAALESELAFKPSDYRFTASELATIDHIHTRGYAATVDLSRAVGITPEMQVLDLGSGLGGPARYLAETYGCRVDGVDANPGLIGAANYLSSRWVGPHDLVTFTIGDATSIPFPDESFDLVWMQHVAMNIADRAGLYGEIRRVLRHSGRLATYDVLRANGQLIYPTPWAKEASESTVLPGDQTRGTMERAGLRIVSFWLDTPAALEWVRTTVAALPPGERPPGALMLRAALGDNFREIVGNLGKNYVEGRADVAAIIAQREG
jgi:ubiquinone/menaquinone biosynthesis C-methylase UbiE